jgi:murein DD-endopeptidase MepM/ murein hydrolase activator NlpD
MTLKAPLKTIWITQPFGVDWTLGLLPIGKNPDGSTKYGNYSSFGMKGHNGIDFKAPQGTEVLATHDGFVLIDEVRGGYGNAIMLRSEKDGKDTLYGHLSESRVLVDQKVRAGDVIALSGGTPGTPGAGSSTGPHFHFGLRPIKYNGDNGYFGWENPLPYFEKGWDNLPVDNFYGKKRNWSLEYSQRFFDLALQHWMIKKYRRIPPLLSGKETNALVYGGWLPDEVLNDAFKGLWYFLTKEEFKAGKKPPITI